MLVDGPTLFGLVMIVFFYSRAKTEGERGDHKLVKEIPTKRLTSEALSFLAYWHSSSRIRATLSTAQRAKNAKSVENHHQR